MAAELARQDNPSPEQLFSTLEEMTMLDGTIHSTTGMLVYDDTAAAHDYIVRGSASPPASRRPTPRSATSTARSGPATR